MNNEPLKQVFTRLEHETEQSTTICEEIVENLQLLLKNNKRKVKKKEFAYTTE